MEQLFHVADGPIDARRVEAAVAHPAAGAISTFTGIVRDNSGGRPASHLEYEAYRPMAEAEMRHIGDEVAARWPGARTAMMHRVGRLEIGEASVVIAVAAAHRAEAIAACHWAIDELKARVPIWKKEFTPDGGFWVEGPSTDPSPLAAPLPPREGLGEGSARSVPPSGPGGPPPPRGGRDS